MEKLLSSIKQIEPIHYVIYVEPHVSEESNILAQYSKKNSPAFVPNTPTSGENQQTQLYMPLLDAEKIVQALKSIYTWDLHRCRWGESSSMSCHG